MEATLSESRLRAWGERIGREIARPAVLALRGDLGTGKSTLARAIAAGLGIQGDIPSPTFNLLFAYPLPAGGRLLHFDLYRLRDPEEVWELGWEDVGAGRDLALIEWPERAESLLPEPRWDVALNIATPGTRRVTAASTPGAPDLPPPP